MNSQPVANQFQFLILTDPVTIGTGHSCDRSSLMKWFRAGKPICPKTGEKMKNMEVVPNLALKRLIQQYCNKNRNRNVGMSTVGSLAAEGAMKMVAEFINGSETQENAVAGLLNLSKHLKGKAVIVENGGVDLVVDVLKEDLKVEACQHAAGTLFYLALIEEYWVLIRENPRALLALRELIKNEICSSSGHYHAQD
ncbi:putative aminoacyltransferase, E1 ubiquitin-activating enzyme [Rosa chinensis]|uniref:RING-type E3 ubiquitin transferase n=1 Tax=Rosa chinensis TaxID=74649 RepID=A0A2P6QDB1_ROSCH|nr:putative aminoacyltransferase, E1 ubiquitin-activating enzyme [Rosa chinensis]